MIYQHGPVCAFAARDGTERWTKMLPGVRGHVDSGLVREFADVNGFGIEILNSEGRRIARRSITATRLSTLRFFPSRDGTTLAVLGTFSGTLDLGGTTLESAIETDFIALLDMAGTTRWAHTLDLLQPCDVAPCEYLHRLAPMGDEIVVSGVGRGVHDLPASTLVPSAFLGVFGRAGLQRVVPMLSPSGVAPGAIYPATDGSVWALIRSAGITIGSTTYADTTAATYIVNIVP